MPPPDRRLVHTRSIQVEAYARSDLLWDLEATVRDVKTKDFQLVDGVRAGGTSFHEMLVTVTIDARMTIREVQARTLAAPFPGFCDAFPGEVYRRLIGLNLLQNFRAQVRERVGGVEGCTHITELMAVLPTAAIQAFSGEVQRPDRREDDPPRSVDGCRALRSDGPVVARIYPRWYRPPGGSTS